MKKKDYGMFSLLGDEKSKENNILRSLKEWKKYLIKVLRLFLFIDIEKNF